MPPAANALQGSRFQAAPHMGCRSVTTATATGTPLGRKINHNSDGFGLVASHNVIRFRSTFLLAGPSCLSIGFYLALLLALSISFDETEARRSQPLGVVSANHITVSPRF